MTKSRVAVATALLALTAGCGSGPKLVPVSGTVTLNNKPLEGAIVQFLPDPSDPAGQPAEDQTGPEGNYKAMTKGRSGVVPGKYRVVISKAPQAAAGTTSDQFKDDPFMAQLSSRPEGPAKPGAAKDAREAKIEREFSRDVPPEGGTLDFDVKASAKAQAAAK
jgi:hypothetical protein